MHITPDPDTLELLNAYRKHHVQEVVGSLLYYAQAVNKKLLVALSAIAAHQAKATIATEQAVNLLLDYVATYPNDGIVYPASDMILVPTQMQASSTKPTLAAEWVLTSTFQKNDPFPYSIVPSYLLPK